MVVKTQCADCGATFTARVVELFGREVLRQRYCDACFAAAENAEHSDDAQTAVKRASIAALARWTRICPPLYQDTDVARLPQGVLKGLLDWKYSPSGVVLYGATGKQKTRLMYQLLRSEFDAGRKIVAYSASDFRMSAAQAAMDGNLEEWMQRAATAEIFYFDDLGQMKMTESSEETLFSVVEKRTANLLPIFATTQYVGEEFSSQFIRQDRGKAIARRLREFCQFIAL
jgi:hypothetical protein